MRYLASFMSLMERNSFRYGGGMWNGIHSVMTSKTMGNAIHSVLATNSPMLTRLAATNVNRTSEKPR